MRRDIILAMGALFAVSTAMVVTSWFASPNEVSELYEPKGAVEMIGGRLSALEQKRQPTFAVQKAMPPPGRPMPATTSRMESLVELYGIPPDTHANLLHFGHVLHQLQEAETLYRGGTIPPDLREQRQGVRVKERALLESLPPRYRAAMRRHRVSIRSLARWAGFGAVPWR